MKTFSETRRVRCELLGQIVTLPVRPQRIVSLASGFTEAIFEMNFSERIAAVSSYCARYVDAGARPVAGNYLQIDENILREVGADLVLLTGGVQSGVARKLAAAGFPVFVLPVPNSFAGILENIRALGALLGEMPAALKLTARMDTEAAQLRATTPVKRPRIFPEIWFGRHLRTIGGLTFTHDIIDLAGGENINAGIAGAYLKPDFDAVAVVKPDIVLVFWEEDDTPIDVPKMLSERGWIGRADWQFSVIEAGIKRGQNLIHDGPSILETAAWLRERITLCAR